MLICYFIKNFTSNFKSTGRATLHTILTAFYSTRASGLYTNSQTEKYEIIYISTYCVETVKQLDYNRYSHLTRRFSGKAAALGARGPGFNFWLWQVSGSIFGCGFMFDFLFCCWCVFTFCQKHIICHKILQFLLKCQFIAKLVTDYKGIKIRT